MSTRNIINIRGDNGEEWSVVEIDSTSDGLPLYEVQAGGFTVEDFIAVAAFLLQREEAADVWREGGDLSEARVLYSAFTRGTDFKLVEDDDDAQ